MTVRGTANTETASQTARPIITASRTGAVARSWVRSRRQLLVVSALIFSDVLLALAVWQAAFVLYGILGRGSISEIAIAGIVPSVILWVGLRASLGLYPGYGLGPVEELRKQTLAVLGTLTIAVLSAFASQVADSLSRALLFAWSLGLLLLAPVVRYCAKSALMKARLWCKPVVILGAQKAGACVIKVLKREWQLGFKPVGVFDDRVAPTGGLLEGVPYKGTLADAVALAQDYGVDTAILAMPNTRREHLARFVSMASSRFRHTVVIPNLDGVTNSGVVARDFGGTFGVEIKHNLLDPWAQRLKRAIDFGATVVGGMLVLPLVLVLALLVWAESGGSVFYKDKRMGRDGGLFSCLKFRTMVPNAEDLLQQTLEKDEKGREEYSRYHKLRNDPRVTRVGRFLRNTSLDELS